MGALLRSDQVYWSDHDHAASVDNGSVATDGGVGDYCRGLAAHTHSTSCALGTRSCLVVAAGAVNQSQLHPSRPPIRSSVILFNRNLLLLHYVRYEFTNISSTG